MPIDPLQQLRDITLPDPVSAWPPAPGWWLLTLLLLAAMCVGLYFWQRQRRANAYRKAAAEALDRAWSDFEQGGDKQALLQLMPTLLRRTALQAFPRKAVAGLHGPDWLAFLDATSNSAQSKDFSQGEGQALLSAPYQRQVQIDPAPLFKLVKNWVLTHQHTDIGTGADTTSSISQEVSSRA